MRYAVFNPATGEILRLLSCDAATAVLNTAAGQSALEVGQEVSDGTHYLAGIDPVLMPLRPSPQHIFDWTSKAWHDPRTLADLKAVANTRINAARMTANRGGFTHQGKTISSDALSRSDIDGVNGYASLYGTLPPAWPGGWKAVDNSYLAIASLDDWKLFYSAMVAAGNANFAHAQALKAQLAAATTPAQVEAIQW